VNIPLQALDATTTAAVRARLADPRRADRIAEHLAHVGEQRAEIEAAIARWEEAADDLATKPWGVARVNTARWPRFCAKSNTSALNSPPSTNPTPRTPAPPKPSPPGTKHSPTETSPHNE
jgi:hypothetical protein